jgi:RimJ/RimL family protein N-acetyltransferase
MRFEIPGRLDDDRIVLRRVGVDDAPAYARAFMEDPELGRFLGMEQDPTAERVAERAAKAAESTEAENWLELAVCTPADESFMGSVMLHSVAEQHRRCEIGFWLTPGARGGGLARAAVAAWVSWIFDELPIDRIEMTTTPDNTPTRRLAARLGFTEEGILRRRNVEREQRVDLVMFGLLREEWTLPGELS